jgi:hypothetical protein
MKELRQGAVITLTFPGEKRAPVQNFRVPIEAAAVLLPFRDFG